MSQSPDTVVAEAQQRITRDVLKWALPTAGGVSLITLTTAIASGMFAQHWSRGVPSIVLLSSCIVGWFELRRSEYDRAVGWLVGGVGLVIFLTLTFNGGIRAPSAMLLPYLVALFGWLYGRTAGTVMAAISAVTVTLYFFLGLFGFLAEPPALPLLGEFVMLLVVTLLIWSATTLPPTRLRAALIESLQRERELKAEQELRMTAANQLQAVFDQSPHVMALVRPDGRLFSINKAALELVGLENGDAHVGAHFSKTPWWNKEDAAQLKAGLPDVLAGKAIHFDTTRTDARGQQRRFEFSLSPFRNAKGEVAWLIAEGRDVTEAALAKERRSLTQRLELVGQLAGGVAHDFNNVLMAIVSSAEVLRLDLMEDGELPPHVAESLDTILNSGRRAGDLTQRLLSFGRRSTTEKQPVSFNRLLRSTIKLLERTLPKNVKLVLEANATADLIDGDSATLESALINLALNARDAMPDGGTITFTTERVELDDEWCRSSGFDLQPGTYLRVSVRDTGTGIAAEHLGRVFEPFFTTKEEGKGTGLGLASVFGVLREHRGAVHVYSERGRGTVFHLSLPLSTNVPQTVRTPSAAPQFQVRALVVDDEAPIRRMLPRLLKKLGIEADTAESAEDAMTKLDDSLELLITDIVLPGQRGSVLALEFLKQRPNGRVLLISGFPKDTELSALPADRVRLLGKPFTFEALQEALSELLPPS
ncbi:MAG: hybrid sensor histidine kinase/response regulator [Archangium sp.]